MKLENLYEDWPEMAALIEKQKSYTEEECEEKYRKARAKREAQCGAHKDSEKFRYCRCISLMIQEDNEIFTQAKENIARAIMQNEINKSKGWFSWLWN